MNHLAEIVAEFDKLAAWGDYTQRRQRDYLHRHPGSRFRVNAPSSTGETCPNCGSSKFRVKDHGDWEGYHCPDCGQGGSRNKRKNKFRERRKFLQQLRQIHNLPRQSQPYDPEEAAAEREIRQPADFGAFSPTKSPENIVETPIIDIHPDWYNKQSKTFAVELSEMGDSATTARTLYLRNPKTGVKVKFNRVGEDKDSTNEDTYGYRYESENGDVKLLIIND
jgi:uncharacterized Zn finger protein (UPF0148 family)